MHQLQVLLIIYFARSARVSTISCLYMFVTFIIFSISELFKFDHYRGTRASILDPCIQGILETTFQIAICLILIAAALKKIKVEYEF